MNELSTTKWNNAALMGQPVMPPLIETFASVCPENEMGRFASRLTTIS